MGRLPKASKLKADGPRLFVGDFEVVPCVNKRGEALPHLWAWPGRKVLTTIEASRLAEANGLSFTIQK